MIRLAIFFISLAALLGGCQPSRQDAGGAVLNGEMPPAAGAATGDEQEGFFFIIRLNLTFIELPVGTASQSGDIWSHLDEEPIAAARSGELWQNGLRVGRGTRDNWPDLAALLRQLTAKSFHRSTITALPGEPTAVKLKTQGITTIATVYDNESFTLNDYPPGDNTLAICCTLDEDDPTKILVTVAPQIRSAHRKTRISKDDAGVTVTTKPVIYNFDSLVFQLTVPTRDFLLIAPGAQSRKPHSVGRHFLIRRKKGVEFETILVIAPEVIAVPLKGQGG